MATSVPDWDPPIALHEVRPRIDRLCEDVSSGDRWTPATDVMLEDDMIVLRADLPGVRPEEVGIQIAHGVLTIHGQRGTTEGDYVRRERRPGSFSRSIGLPAGAPAAEIEATCTDGVLEVRVPVPRLADGAEV
jgi:HSP20 family protein